MLGSPLAFGAILGMLPQGRRLLARDLFHPREEVVDECQLGVRVAADLIGARLADPPEGGLDRGDLHDLPQ